MRPTRQITSISEVIIAKRLARVWIPKSLLWWNHENNFFRKYTQNNIAALTTSKHINCSPVGPKVFYDDEMIPENIMITWQNEKKKENPFFKKSLAVQEFSASDNAVRKQVAQWRHASLHFLGFECTDNTTRYFSENNLNFRPFPAESKVYRKN